MAEFKNHSLEIGNVGLGENADGTFNSFPMSELAERTIARDILEKAWAGAEAEVFGSGVPDKAEHAAVNYRKGTEVEHCSICAMYRGPDDCTSVVPPIKPDGTCDLYEPDAEPAGG